MPDHLRSKIGTTELTFSLKTSSLGEAKRLRNLEEVRWDAKLKAVQGPSSVCMPIVPGAAEVVAVRAYMAGRGVRTRDMLVDNSPTSEDERSEMLENVGR